MKALLATAALYFISGRLGLHLAFVHANATAVWPPTGIALAVAVLYGPRVWPAVFLGAFLVNWTLPSPLLVSLGIAAGNTLEAVVGAALIARWAGGKKCLETPRAVLAFTASVMAAAAVSATIGVAVLGLAGLAPWPGAASIWYTWWAGDMGGGLIIAPAALLLFSRKERAAPREAVAVFAALALLSWGVFLGGLAPAGYPVSFLFPPLILWAAFRLGQSWSALAVVALAAASIAGTLLGNGPFYRDAPAESLLILQCYLGVTAITSLCVAAVVSGYRRTQAELKRKDAVQRAFVANASHELRTPLAAIKGFAETLRRGALHDEKNSLRFVETIERHADHLTRLVDDLLALAAHDDGQTRPRLEAVELSAFLARFLEENAPVAKARKVAVSLEGVPPLRVLADRDQLDRVLANLLSNAIKFNKTGGKVRVSACRKGALAQITVADTGRGIPRSELGAIFDRFHRVGGKGERVAGTGLGLAIVKSIVDAHGGKVWAESVEGEGARLHFTLPLA